jgi:hypothetical protein
MGTIVRPVDHPETAKFVPLAPEKNLVPNSTVTIAHGEMANNDLPKINKPQPEPLGDVARRYRHDFPTKVVTNQ